jgi:hypothetical protein
LSKPIAILRINRIKYFVSRLPSRNQCYRVRVSLLFPTVLPPTKTPRPALLENLGWYSCFILIDLLSLIAEKAKDHQGVTPRNNCSRCGQLKLGESSSWPGNLKT